MTELAVTSERLAEFASALRAEERLPATVEKYVRDVRRFGDWLGGEPVSRSSAAEWREQLAGRLSAATVNAMLAALNKFFAVMGRADCRVKPLRTQRRAFRSAGRELTRGEYERLVAAARGMGRERTALVMETLCATGIRVSELRYITVEAARAGRAVVRLKGKTREILIPERLRRALLRYAKTKKTASGEVFLTRNGCPISRKQVWAEMKAVCYRAGVPRSKVFPHNLRHLFARAFYSLTHDVAKLADVLGHSSIETTRIYLISTGEEHVRLLNRLSLVLATE